MAIFDDNVRQQVKKEFEKLQNNVKLVVFTQELECQYCRENRMLVEEIAALSDKVTTKIYNFAIDKEKATAYRVDKIPAIVVEGDKDYGIRFYGIPAGYEFISLIEAIKIASARDSGLSSESKELLKKITEPVHIQVFITPTCPYCPGAVKLAHKSALENDFITADMIEAAEFPHLANKYNVFGVPKTIINEKIQFEGALPESAFVSQLMSTIKVMN